MLLRDPGARRKRLALARLQLILTPEVCPERDALEVLRGVLEWIDVVQVRPKPTGAAPAPTPAREALDWTARVLEAVEGSEVLVIVNDRVDVARTLMEAGCDGVHLGQEDTPPRVARELLGEGALIGLSTHDAREVALAGDEPVDYLGFGPVFATATKGVARGLGPEAAWVAAEAAAVPVFAIGGIDLGNVDQLDRVGRAAVSSAVLAAAKPGEVARGLRELLAS